MTKRPRAGQIVERGKRIKATENHFNMECTDTNGPPVEQTVDEQTLPGIDPTYAALFDNVVDSGKSE